MFQDVQNTEAVSFRKTNMLCFLDHCLGATQSMPQDEIRKVSIFERRRPQEHRLFLGPNPHGHSVIVFYCYPWHGGSALFCTYSNGTHELPKGQIFICVDRSRSWV